MVFKTNFMASLKPGHLDWIRDFDFMLNLFPPKLLPVPETDSLPITLVASSEPSTSKIAEKIKILQPQLYHKD